MSQEYKELWQVPESETWITEFSNDLGRLAQRVRAHTPKGNNTILFIPRGKILNRKRENMATFLQKLHHTRQKPTASISHWEETY